MKNKKYTEDGKRIPQRMCVACRSMLDKASLIRVMHAGGSIIIDVKHNKNGRGAYLCKREECVDKAMKTRGLQRGLKMAVPDDVYEECFKECKKTV